MPGVESNQSKLRCRNCGSVYHLEPSDGVLPPCQKCGIVAYERIVIQPVCDFCSDPLPLDGEAWTFPCEAFSYPFQMGTLTEEGIKMATEEGSGDDWAACDTCHDLVEDGDRIALAERSVQKDIERHPSAASERHMLMAMTRAMQDKFFDHRNGEAFREEVRPDV